MADRHATDDVVGGGDGESGTKCRDVRRIEPEEERPEIFVDGG